MRWRVGAIALDRHWREPVRIRHVLLVPTTRDLFGAPIPGHRRYTVEYRDGRWSNERYDDDLAPLDDA